MAEIIFGIIVGLVTLIAFGVMSWSIYILLTKFLWEANAVFYVNYTKYKANSSKLQRWIKKHGKTDMILQK